MQKDQHKTKVIFRKFSDGDIIALFPELPGNNNPYETCESYMHVGQHGAASVDLTDVTTLAKPEEYASLLSELESIGYNVQVAYKFTQKDLQKRIKATKNTQQIDSKN